MDNLTKGNERIVERLTGLPDISQIAKEIKQLTTDKMSLLKKLAAAQENLAGKSDLAAGVKAIDEKLETLKQPSLPNPSPTP